MPSHYCKCGHCSIDSSDVHYYEDWIRKSKEQIWFQIFSIYNEGYKELNKIKTASTAEEGKAIEKVKESLKELINKMKYEKPDFSIKKEG